MSQPWNLDYPSHSFELVSPELPSGSAWLVNCLLELGVPFWQPWELANDHEWQRVSAHRYQYTAHELPWQQTLPALQAERVFEFEPALSGRVTHRWAGTVNRGRPLILFVRDPRDMLYSQWRRNSHNLPGYSAGFTEFLTARYHHFPCSNMEYLLYYLLLWQAGSAAFDCHIVRFEDYRSDAVQTLKQVLRFLAIKRDDQAIEQAARRSDFRVVSEIENRLQQEGRLQRKFNYAAQPYEYRGHLDAATARLFDPRFNQLAEWLGYQPFTESVAASQTSKSAVWVEQMVTDFTGGQLHSPYRQPARQLLQQVLSAPCGVSG